MADEKYGKKNQETGEWNGMMGELLAQVMKICMHDACSLHSHKCLESGGYGAASMNFKQSFRVAANWQLEYVIRSGCSKSFEEAFH